MSPYLFITALELLSIYVQNDKSIHGVDYNQSEIKLLLYADDITAILESQADARRLFTLIKEFGKCSGLKINESKSEGMWLGTKKNCNRKPFNIKGPSTIKLLGVHVGYDVEVLKEKNFRGKINKVKQKLNIWKQKDLTIYGKILIIKAFALSQFMYVAAVCQIPKKVVNEVEGLLYEFLWNGKSHKVKTKVVIQEYENGGCKMVDLEEMIKAQQIKMIKRLLANENLLWKPTMEVIIGISNLDLFLRSNFPVPKNTSNFYTAVLKSWKEFKYETFNSKEDILNQYLWYNEKLKITNKTIYLKSFDDCGIRKIADITNEDGSLKSYNDVCSTFNTATTNAALYAKVVKAIPTDWKELIKKREIYVIDNNCYVNTNGDKTELQNMNQKSIYKALVIKKLDWSAAYKKYTATYNLDEDEWKSIYLMPHTLPISNKAKEMHYKIVHGYVATNHLLYKMDIVNSDVCTFCKHCEQTVFHLFYDCNHVKRLWLAVEQWLTRECGIDLKFCAKDVLFGVVEKDNFLNSIICYARLYIMKCKIQDKQIAIEGFLNLIENEGVLYPI